MITKYECLISNEDKIIRKKIILSKTKGMFPEIVLPSQVETKNIEYLYSTCFKPFNEDDLKPFYSYLVIIILKSKYSYLYLLNNQNLKENWMNSEHDSIVLKRLIYELYTERNNMVSKINYELNGKLVT